MEIGTGCYKIKRIPYTEKINIDSKQLAQNKQIERTFTKILRTLKGLDYRIEEDDKFTYFYYHASNQPINKKSGVAAKECKEYLYLQNPPKDSKEYLISQKPFREFEQFLQEGYNLTRADVYASTVQGEFIRKQPNNFFKKFIPFLQSVPEVIVFHDSPRDINGKFQSKYNTWRKIAGVKKTVINQCETQKAIDVTKELLDKLKRSMEKFEEKK